MTPALRNYRITADYFRIALAAGLRSSKDVAAWADSIVARDTDPPVAFFELTLAGHKDQSTVADLLEQIPGPPDPIASARAALADLLECLDRDDYGPYDVAKLCYNMATLGHLPDTSFGFEPLAIEDAFSLARDGIYGTEAEATTRLRTFLQRHAAWPAA